MKRMLIERGAMGQKNEVKLEDIADSLGVSIVTVSNALKGKKGVSEGLRNRIKEAAQRMGYKTPVYEEKEKARSHIIGVLVAERYVKEFPSFYMEIYRRVAQETAKRGHVTVLEVVTCEKENLSADAMVFFRTVHGWADCDWRIVSGIYENAAQSEPHSNCVCGLLRCLR